MVDSKADHGVDPGLAEHLAHLVAGVPRDLGERVALVPVSLEGARNVVSALRRQIVQDIGEHDGVMDGAYGTYGEIEKWIAYSS